MGAGAGWRGAEEGSSTLWPPLGEARLEEGPWVVQLRGQLLGLGGRGGPGGAVGRLEDSGQKGVCPQALNYWDGWRDSRCPRPPGGAGTRWRATLGA